MVTSSIALGKAHARSANEELELFLGLFGSRKREAVYAAAGDRLYVIGDVHGRHDLLVDIFDRIERHNGTLPQADNLHIVMLGDLIDRGPDSAKVLRTVYNVQRKTDRLTVLLGNHEELMLRALNADPGALRAWMRVGGTETLRSLGLEPPSKECDAREVADQIRSAIPAEWVTWLEGLPLTARSGDYLFCHAGIRPGVSIRRQRRLDLLWIRDQFLEDPRDHGMMIVHGHSISADVELRSNRIGIDTGAYRTGILTALYLEGEERGIISTEGAVEPDGVPSETAVAGGTETGEGTGI